MRDYIISGKLVKIEPRTSKTGNPYSIIKIEDKDGIVEMVAGSKVEVPPIGSYVLCGGSIRSTSKTYEDRVFYSYSFLVDTIETITKFEVTQPEENSVPDVNLSDLNIPF